MRLTILECGNRMSVKLQEFFRSGKTNLKAISREKSQKDRKKESRDRGHGTTLRKARTNSRCSIFFPSSFLRLLRLFAARFLLF